MLARAACAGGVSHASRVTTRMRRLDVHTLASWLAWLAGRPPRLAPTGRLSSPLLQMRPFPFLFLLEVVLCLQSGNSLVNQPQRLEL